MDVVRLLPVTALKHPVYESLYKFGHFNSVQSKAFRVLYESDDNALVAAPIGSGKTICAELAILRNHQKVPLEFLKVVYLAPSKALAKERYDDWKKKFEYGLGMTVVELIGDPKTDQKLLKKAHIVITTPQQWDNLYRIQNMRSCMCYISLFIVAGLDMVGGPGGALLEVVVTRMTCIARDLNEDMRIVALSSCVANAEELGDWIGVTSHGLFSFSPIDRLVPLDIHIHGVDIPNFAETMPAMTKCTYEAILQHANEGEPAIAFVPHRKHAYLAARDLVEYSRSSGDSEIPMFLLQNVDSFVAQLKGDLLKQTILGGVAYLHEGLCFADQEIVRTLFKESRVQVCVVSSSMSWEVSLPSRLVVVMGTHDCKGNTFRDYPIIDLQKMMGRAGRPRVDTSGIFVILSHEPHRDYDKESMFEAFPVESQLQHSLPELLNVEVTAESIHNMHEALDSLTSTFLYRRLHKNPRKYGIQGSSMESISEHLTLLLKKSFDDLEQSNCVAIENQVSLVPTGLGALAVKHYISYTTAKYYFSNLNSSASLRDLVESLAAASEYEQLQQLSVSLGENESITCSVDQQRFSSSTLKGPNLRAFMLIQSHLSGQPIDADMLGDRQMVVTLSKRLAKFLVNLCACMCSLGSTFLAIDLHRMLVNATWNVDSELQQLPHFTGEAVEQCRCRDISINHLCEMSHESKRLLLRMSDIQVRDIDRFLALVPTIEVQCSVKGGRVVKGGAKVSVRVTIRRRVPWIEAGLFEEREHWWLLLVNSKKEVVDVEYIDLVHELHEHLYITAPKVVGKVTYTLYVMCDTYVGRDQRVSFDVYVV